jgi:hypothetical protein
VGADFSSRPAPRDPSNSAFIRAGERIAQSPGLTRLAVYDERKQSAENRAAHNDSIPRESRRHRKLRRRAKRQKQRRSRRLAQLNRAVAEREGWMVVVESDPAFDPLRSNPEYVSLVHDLHATADGAN